MILVGGFQLTDIIEGLIVCIFWKLAEKIYNTYKKILPAFGMFHEGHVPNGKYLYVEKHMEQILG